MYNVAFNLHLGVIRHVDFKLYYVSIIHIHIRIHLYSKKLEANIAIPFTKTQLHSMYIVHLNGVILKFAGRGGDKILKVDEIKSQSG